MADLSNGRSPLVLLFPCPPVPVPICYRVHHLQLLSRSHLCSIVFFQFSGKVQILIFLFTFLQIQPVVRKNGKDNYLAVFLLFFSWLSLDLVIWPRLDDSFVSQSPREFCATHFPEQILGWVSVPLFRFPFTRHFLFFSCEIFLVYRLQRLYSCFSSHFCFSGYFCSIDACIVCIVSCRWNNSSSALFM